MANKKITILGPKVNIVRIIKNKMQKTGAISFSEVGQNLFQKNLLKKYMVLAFYTSVYSIPIYKY